MKILTVVGARPQFIKAAPVSRVIAKRGDIEEVIVHTGQHFDANMSDCFFHELAIPAPKYHLGIHSLRHGAMTGAMLAALEEVILAEKPDCVLVYGDTNSTLAGALAAVKVHVPVAHVEAGLRSFNRKMPEEINRVLTDHISAFLFCPTYCAVENLSKEGIVNGVYWVGDVMYDAALFAHAHAKHEILRVTRNHPFVLLTLHRQENTANLNRLVKLLDFVKKETEKRGLDVVFPVHPRTKKMINKHSIHLYDFIVIPPVSYLEMAALLQACEMVFTDSGGLQKEAYFARKRCITLREETEWIETIESGWNRLWTMPDYQKDPPVLIKEYGDGRAAERIVGYLCQETFKKG